MLVKVPTKDLFFGIYIKRNGWDEYQSIAIIPVRNIIFPDDKRYSEIEKGNSYLDSEMKI